jgi:hypothetical protein
MLKPVFIMKADEIDNESLDGVQILVGHHEYEVSLGHQVI